MKPLEAIAVVQKYGQAMAPYLYNPEIGPILLKAAREGWAEDVTRLALQNTQYWKNTVETMRNWEVLQFTDPAAANRQLDESLAVVRDTLSNFGIDWLSESDQRRLANDRIAMNWSENNDAMFKDIVGNLLNQSPKRNEELVGSVGNLMAQLKANAAQQLLTLDNASAYNYATRISQGDSTLEAYNVAFRQQAKVKAPWAAQMIDDGVMLADLFDQHRQRIGQQLEVDPESIDLVNDPRWRSVVNYTDPKTNQIRAMTETEAEILARQQPEWSNTATANDQASQLTDTLSTTWGVRGRG